MTDDSGIGRRLVSVRKRRGLTQQELADQATVSVSVIRRLEQGDQAGIRVETLRKLASTLRVPTTDLDPPPDTAADELHDADAWEPVQRALEGRADAPPPEEAPTVQGLREAVDAYKPLFRASNFAELRPHLVRLIRDADLLVDEAGNGMRADARRERSRVRQMVAWLMALTWQMDYARDAAQLALDDAPDTRAAVPVIDAECWRLIRQRNLDGARALAIRWADDIEPVKFSKATPEQLASWGIVLLRVSTAAVRDNRPGESEDALKLARMAGMGLNRGEYSGRNGYLHSFGPMTVQMIEAENAMVLDQPDRTLGIADGLAELVALGHRYPIPWVWHRHRLDVAQAHLTLRRYDEALATLQEIRRAAQPWLAEQRYARDILGAIIDRRRTLTDEMRDLADAIRLPY